MCVHVYVSSTYLSSKSQVSSVHLASLLALEWGDVISLFTSSHLLASSGPCACYEVEPGKQGSEQHNSSSPQLLLLHSEPPLGYQSAGGFQEANGSLVLEAFWL